MGTQSTWDSFQFTFDKMKAVLLLSVLASALAAPETRFLCSECVDEMHNLGFLVKAGSRDIRDYLAANYCPTVEESQQEFCIEKLARYYIGMLDAIVHHYFMDGAVHICQTMGVCDAMRSGRYTCKECVQGLEWVEAYIEDPIMIRVCHLPRAELLPRRVGGMQGARYPGLPQNARDGHGEVLHTHRDLQPARGLWSSPSDQAATIRRKKLYHGRKFI